MQTSSTRHHPKLEVASTAQSFCVRWFIGTRSSNQKHDSKIWSPLPVIKSTRFAVDFIGHLPPPSCHLFAPPTTTTGSARKIETTIVGPFPLLFPLLNTTGLQDVDETERPDSQGQSLQDASRRARSHSKRECYDTYGDSRRAGALSPP